MTEYTVITVTIVSANGQSECGSRVYYDSPECGFNSLEDAFREAAEEADERASDYLDSGFPTRCFTSITKMPAPKHSGPTIQATLTEDDQATVTATIS